MPKRVIDVVGALAVLLVTAPLLALGALLTLAPSSDFQGSSLARMKTLLALFLYVTTGGHLVLIEGLANSLRVLPPGAPLRFVTGASEALNLMEARKITALPVVGADGTLLGVIQIHDLWRTELF